MPGDGRLWRGFAAMIAALAAAAAAAPTGRALGRWIILRDAAPRAGLGQPWVVALAGLLVIAMAVVLAAQTARRAIVIGFCLVLLGVAGMGAWQAVAAGAAAYRDGPLNAAL